MDMETLKDEGRRFLQKESAVGGPTLSEHLTQVLLKLIVERPENANTLFESISLELRKPPPEPSAEESKSEPVEPPAEGADPLASTLAVASKQLPAEAQAAKIQAWLDGHKKYLLPIPPKPEPVEGEEPAEAPAEEEPVDPGTAGQVSEVLDDSTLWEQAGLGFGEELTFRLFRSLQLLAGREGDDCKIRFWGKIIARHGDYYIAQVVLLLLYFLCFCALVVEVLSSFFFVTPASSWNHTCVRAGDKRTGRARPGEDGVHEEPRPFGGERGRREGGLPARAGAAGLRGGGLGGPEQVHVLGDPGPEQRGLDQASARDARAGSGVGHGLGRRGRRGRRGRKVGGRVGKVDTKRGIWD